MTAKKASEKSFKKVAKKVVEKVVRKKTTKKSVKKVEEASPEVIKTEKKVAKKTMKKPAASDEKKVTKVTKSVKKAVVKKTSGKKVTSKATEEKDVVLEKTAKKVAKKAVKKVAKAAVTKKSIPEKIPKEKAVSVEKVEEVVVEQTPVVEASPVEAPQVSQNTSDNREYWQDKYQDDKLRLLIRDPYWCFAYWDLSADNQSIIIKSIRNEQTKLLIRVYDVTDVEFDGSNAHQFKDIEVSEEASNWYINVWSADRSYCVDLGLLYPNGDFKTILRSNAVTTPRDSISPIVDEEWMVVDETFDQLYQNAGVGHMGRSSEAITKYMLKRVRADVTSGGLASMGSEGGRPKPVKSEDFWLVAHTELIVYGATEPNAKLTIQDQPMALNSDGTFSVRFALPDGMQRIHIKAVNEAETQERSITPIVEKRTE